MKNELYRLTDSFLVEATNAKGEHRSLERLNADRHLFVENVMELINRQIDSAVEADRARIKQEVQTIIDTKGYESGDVVLGVIKFLESI